MEALCIIDIVLVTIFIFYATSEHAIIAAVGNANSRNPVTSRSGRKFRKKIRECTGWQAFIIKDATIHPSEIVLSNIRDFYRTLGNVYKRGTDINIVQ